MSEGRPGRAERCGGAARAGMMNGKSVTGKTKARGLALHPDVREGSSVVSCGAFFFVGSCKR